MGSELIIVSVEKLQSAIAEAVRAFHEKKGVYVSLNKPVTRVHALITGKNISSTSLFYIDCVSKHEESEDIITLSPRELSLLLYALKRYIAEITDERFLIIDSLATLLIYNDENKVARFVQEITDLAAREKVQLLVFSQKTQGEDLLHKVYNFFDKVDKK